MTRLSRNRMVVVLILLSVGVLEFWQVRFSESRPAQRLVSISNPNDFSWRNRVTAWEGAVRMMVDRPFIGFGWGKAESIYAKKYCPLDESAAIEMNDYLMIGISAGVPAMVCFFIYLWLSLVKRPEILRQESELGTSQGLLTSSPTKTSPLPGLLPSQRERRGDIQTTCRAGAIVLLVGFWFDGGLFKLPTATVFWMLLELGSVQRGGAEVQSDAEIHPEKRHIEPSDVGCYKGGSKWLRWVAGILAALALAETCVHLGTPFLSVSHNTLSIARKCLIPAKEIGDFDFLSAEPIWQGHKLKTLLDHVDLANYNRTLINWQVDDTKYRDYVLSPVITGTPGELLEWRRPLWEEFYPRIRHESSPEDAAKIVVRHLRERVTIAAGPNLPQDVPAIWRRQITDAAGFEIIYVAALRSVGVPARLEAQGQAEFWDGNQWLPAPRPILE